MRRTNCRRVPFTTLAGDPCNNLLRDHGLRPVDRVEQASPANSAGSRSQTRARTAPSTTARIFIRQSEPPEFGPELDRRQGHGWLELGERAGVDEGGTSGLRRLG